MEENLNPQTNSSYSIKTTFLLYKFWLASTFIPFIIFKLTELNPLNEKYSSDSLFDEGFAFLMGGILIFLLFFSLYSIIFIYYAIRTYFKNKEIISFKHTVTVFFMYLIPTLILWWCSLLVL